VKREERIYLKVSTCVYVARNLECPRSTIGCAKIADENCRENVEANGGKRNKESWKLRKNVGDRESSS